MTDLLPTFLIAGVPKAGTSSVANWLSGHPQVLSPLEKESCFFADEGSHIYRPDYTIGLGIGAYQAGFGQVGWDRPVVLDATPAHIYQTAALTHVPALSSAPKVLFILRNPADQIRSVFQYYRDNWDFIPAELDFTTYLQQVRGGHVRFGGNELAERPLHFADYGPFLRQWRDALGPDRFRVWTFEDLVAHPADHMRGLADWLGIDAGHFDGLDYAPQNESYAPRNRALQAANIRLRGLLPKGRVYTALRGLYRRLNTRKPPPEGRDERDDLMAEFLDRTIALERDFGLDLSAWKPDRTRA